MKNARSITHASRAPLVVALALAVLHPVASADSLTKEQCIDAHSRGQDAREQGKLSLARRLFMTCAQASCPALVQTDCARFTDDLTRQQPSLTFVSRDAQGADLPDTAVYVDGNLVLTRLDDGKPHDIDPGPHTVRFTCNGRDQTLTLVVGTGEKGRIVAVTFAAINPVHAPPRRSDTTHRESITRHPRGSRWLIGGGAALTVTGAVLGVLGVVMVPSNCSISSNHCTAPPGDPVFARARSGMQVADIGIAMTGAGMAVLAGGLTWYHLKATVERPVDDKMVAPVLTGGGIGLALSGRF